MDYPHEYTGQPVICPFCGQVTPPADNQIANFCTRCGCKLFEICPRCWLNNDQPTRSGGTLCERCFSKAREQKYQIRKPDLALTMDGKQPS